MILDDRGGQRRIDHGWQRYSRYRPDLHPERVLEVRSAKQPRGTIPQQLVTPKACIRSSIPLPWKVLPLSVSGRPGQPDPLRRILRQIGPGNTLTVFGYSPGPSSSLVAGSGKRGCVNTPTCGIDPDTPINFVLIGNEMNQRRLPLPVPWPGSAQPGASPSTAGHQKTRSPSRTTCLNTTASPTSAITHQFLGRPERRVGHCLRS